MHVLYTNISNPRTINFRGKEEVTGYFKTPVSEIYLTKDGVKEDCVADLIHHGGADKACYLYGNNHYDYWQKQYPEINLLPGAFGENITVIELHEDSLHIGDVLDIGEAQIQVSQPRQPCYKMGIYFRNQEVVNLFRQADCPGVYVKVLKEGWVRPGDTLKLVEQRPENLTVNQLYSLIYEKNPNLELLQSVIENTFVPQNVKNYLQKKLVL